MKVSYKLFYFNLLASFIPRFCAIPFNLFYELADLTMYSKK